jgi:hypothetical protein
MIITDARFWLNVHREIAHLELSSARIVATQRGSLNEGNRLCRNSFQESKHNVLDKQSDVEVPAGADARRTGHSFAG